MTSSKWRLSVYICIIHISIKINCKHRIFALFVAKKMYELHMIVHTIDEFSPLAEGYFFIPSYGRSYIRWTYMYVFRLKHRTQPKYTGS